MSNFAFLGTVHIHTPDFVNRVNARPGSAALAVWDSDGDSAARRAADLRCPVASGPEEICARPDIDAVIICSETSRHAELVAMAAAAGKHLFVEKPLGMSAADAAQMQRQIEAAGVIFQTGYFMRSLAEYRFLKAQMEAGAFGPVYRAKAANCHKGSLVGLFDEEWRWMADPARAGCGGFGDLGFHSLDLLLWMLGEVESVTAVVDGGSQRYGEADELGEAILRFRNGTLATLSSGWTDRLNPVPFLLSGRDGAAALLPDGLQLAGPAFDGQNPDLPDALPHAFELFLNAVESGEPKDLVPVAQAAYGNRVIDAMYQSARDARTVPLD
ncbi:MAG: Gfo/Idh/MocA family oxidoreductase [Verrucomicrobiota bacterium]